MRQYSGEITAGCRGSSFHFKTLKDVCLIPFIKLTHNCATSLEREQKQWKLMCDKQAVVYTSSKQWTPLMSFAHFWSLITDEGKSLFPTCHKMFHQLWLLSICHQSDWKFTVCWTILWELPEWTKTNLKLVVWLDEVKLSWWFRWFPSGLTLWQIPIHNIWHNLIFIYCSYFKPSQQSVTFLAQITNFPILYLILNCRSTWSV